MSVILAAWLAVSMSTGGKKSGRPVTQEEIAAVKTAILDEIYDYKFEGAYIDILPLESEGYPLHLYIRPNVIEGSGQVIYKLPIGEVARVFESKGKFEVLIREPRDKFPPTSSSTLTLYLDDSIVCAAKKDWISETVYVKAHPSKDEVQAAVARQRKRKGTSEHDEVAKSHK